MQPTPRFSRQTRFDAFGTGGHERLQQARVVVVGLGGLGSSLAAYMARAGVGSLVLVDRDVVEESNLPRQLLYTGEDARLGLPKAEAAVRHLEELAGPTRLEPRAEDFSFRTLDSILEGADLVLDGLDNFEGRYLLNDACHQKGIPWVYGGAVASSGAVLLIGPQGKPCLRCLFPDADQVANPDTCETVGVLSPLPSMVAALQVSEAMRWFAEEDPEPRLWNLDPWYGRAFVAPLERQPHDCPCCLRGEYPALVAEHSALTTLLCGRGTYQVLPTGDRQLSLEQITLAWQGLGPIRQSRFLARLEVDELIISVFADGRALIQGVDSDERARSIYARYVGC